MKIEIYKRKNISKSYYTYIGVKDNMIIFKLNIDNNLLNALNSTDNTIACMAYINIMCIKNKIQLTKKEMKKIFKDMNLKNI